MFTKNKLVSIKLTLALLFILQAATFMLPAKVLADACIDGTEISAGASSGGREYEFCATRGGYTGDSTKCNHGTKIPDKDRREGTERQFCDGARLGYTVSAGPSTSGEGPVFVRTDCNEA